MSAAGEGNLPERRAEPIGVWIVDDQELNRRPVGRPSDSAVVMAGARDGELLVDLWMPLVEL